MGSGFRSRLRSGWLSVSLSGSVPDATSTVHTGHVTIAVLIVVVTVCRSRTHVTWLCVSLAFSTGSSANQPRRTPSLSLRGHIVVDENLTPRVVRDPSTVEPVANLLVTSNRHARLKSLTTSRLVSCPFLASISVVCAFRLTISVPTNRNQLLLACPTSSTFSFAPFARHWPTLRLSIPDSTSQLPFPSSGIAARRSVSPLTNLTSLVLFALQLLINIVKAFQKVSRLKALVMLLGRFRIVLVCFAH